MRNYLRRIALLALIVTIAMPPASAVTFRDWYSLEVLSGLQPEPTQSQLDRFNRYLLFDIFGTLPIALQQAFDQNQSCLAANHARIAKAANEYQAKVTVCLHKIGANAQRVCLARTRKWNHDYPWPCKRSGHYVNSLTRELNAIAKRQWPVWLETRGGYR